MNVGKPLFLGRVILQGATPRFRCESSEALEYDLIHIHPESIWDHSKAMGFRSRLAAIMSDGDESKPNKDNE